MAGWEDILLAHSEKSQEETKIKSETNATIRCIPFNKEKKLKCIYTQNPAKYTVIFAKAY